jgi:hypothetical protein
MSRSRCGVRGIILAGALGVATALPLAAQVPDWTPPPPPALREEVRPPPPNPAWVWRPGHWKFEGREYIWVPGEWVERAVRGERWTHGYWAQGARGEWIWIPGHWQP